MAILDSHSNAVVIRVVYDGAPLAGKTTSVCALGKGLGASVVTPAEIAGRTVFFDWLDYTGGLFEGHRIRCQIVSAPGQASLASRRRRLLESADVVVFVGDSSPQGFEADQAYLGSLYSVLRQLPGPPVGVVLQANKRDLPDAEPLDRMRAVLEGMGVKVGIVESVATEGTGIRESFVFAVRLALDRVRELMRTNELQNGKPDVDSADDLLDELKRREEGVLNLATETGLTHTRLSELRPHEMRPSEPRTPEIRPVAMASHALEQVVREETAPPIQRRVLSAEALQVRPDTPNERVASGLVWPPIDGRVILQEIGSSHFVLKRSESGDWYGIANSRWKLYNSSQAVFASAEQGRPALVHLARVYAANVRVDSVERCVALAGDGQGNFRLWQITRVS